MGAMDSELFEHLIDRYNLYYVSRVAGLVYISMQYCP